MKCRKRTPWTKPIPEPNSGRVVVHEVPRKRRRDCFTIGVRVRAEKRVFEESLRVGVTTKKDAPIACSVLWTEEDSAQWKQAEASV